jgi:hypothetical protein
MPQGPPPQFKEDDTGERLFAATLDWIAASFPMHKEAADRARRRMEAVHRARHTLTHTAGRYGGGVGSRRAWPPERIRERFRAGSDREFRHADIAVFDEAGRQPLMVVEYVEGEDRDAVAEWWVRQVRPAVVVILSRTHDRIYSGRSYGSVRPSERWDLPMPADFEALADPTDVSVDSLLVAVRRGHPDYVERLVTEWVRSSAAGIHGGSPWRPGVARAILDGLARVEDPELARQVLWRVAGEPRRRDHMWLGDGDDYLEDQVYTDVFVPLLWRLPPEGAIHLMSGHSRPFGPAPGVRAIDLVAWGLLGLRYDPDATFRKEASKMLERRRPPDGEEAGHGLYDFAPAFRKLAITFELSSDLPPLARSGLGSEDESREPRGLHEVLSERLGSASLVTTGFLGNYRPDEGRVYLYAQAITACANALGLRPRHLASVTLIHELLHALSHLGRDMDGRMWSEFALPDPGGPLFEPSWLHETVAQYFTYRHLIALQDTDLMNAFETLSSKQAPAYRTWERCRNIPIEDMRAWFIGLRRGVGAFASGPIVPAILPP